jgi:preprotein translocase subunit SecY
MDTVTQLQSHMVAHQYEGLIRKTKLHSRPRFAAAAAAE